MTEPHFSPKISRQVQVNIFNQCCWSKYIEFGSGSRILGQFGSGSGSRSGSGVMVSILKKEIINNFTEKLFSLQTLLKYRYLHYKMLPKEIFCQLRNWIVTDWYLIYILNLATFVSILSYFYMCGSGSTKLLNTDPVPDPQHCLLFLTLAFQSPIN